MGFAPGMEVWMDVEPGTAPLPPQSPSGQGLLRASPKPSSPSPSAARIPAPCSCSSLGVAAPEQRLIWCL